MCQAIIDMKKEAYDNGFLKGEESGFQNGFHQGEESGFQNGFHQGEENVMSRIALRMYYGKYDLQSISNVTGLDKERIEKIIRAQVEKVKK